QRFQSKQKQFEVNLLQFLIRTNSSTNLIENESFRKIFSDLGINFIRWPDSKSLNDHLRFQFEEFRNRLEKNFLDNSNICLCIDLESLKHLNLWTISAHWIDENCQRISEIISVKTLSNQSVLSSVEIVSAIKQIHQHYRIRPESIDSFLIQNQMDYKDFLEKFGIHIALPDEEFFEEDASSFEQELSKSFNAIRIECCSKKLIECVSIELDRIIREDGCLKELHYSMMKKCNQLWCNQSKQRSVIKPQRSRWTSVFESLKSILESKQNHPITIDFGINGDCEDFVSDRFTEKESEYLDELICCLKPIVDALKILGGEKHAYYGSVISVIYSLSSRMEKLSNIKQWKHCKDLGDALNRSVKTAFNDLFEFRTQLSINAAIATFSHPEFKNRWLSLVPSEKQSVLMLSLRKAIIEETESASKILSTMIDYNDDDRNNPSNHLFNEFFDFGGDLNQTEHAEIEQEIFNYFNDLRKDFSILNDYARIKSVFRRYNAPLPSSYSSRKLIKIEQLINVPNFNFAQSDNDWEQNEKKLLLQMNQ
ncbi:hypothetical protein SSS_10740, partial [Sarcoptes scabiei]